MPLRPAFFKREDRGQQSLSRHVSACALSIRRAHPSRAARAVPTVRSCRSSDSGCCLSAPLMSSWTTGRANSRLPRWQSRHRQTTAPQWPRRQQWFYAWNPPLVGKSPKFERTGWLWSSGKNDPRSPNPRRRTHASNTRRLGLANIDRRAIPCLPASLARGAPGFGRAERLAAPLPGTAGMVPCTAIARTLELPQPLEVHRCGRHDCPIARRSRRVPQSTA